MEITSFTMTGNECHSSEEFIQFLRWVAAGNCSPGQIIDIVEKPWHFKDEFERFEEENKKWEFKNTVRAKGPSPVPGGTEGD